MCPIMLSNQYNYTNSMPLSLLANLMNCDNDFSMIRTLSRKRLLDTNSYRCCDSPPNGKRRRVDDRKKTVRFAEEKNTINVTSVSQEDLKSTWYQPMEVSSFKQESKNAVYELHRVNGDWSKLSKDHCIRGLENVVTPTAAMVNRKNRKERIAAVLYQQQLQRDTSTSNPELLKLISSLFSQPKCEEAVRMAAMDSTVWTQF